MRMTFSMRAMMLVMSGLIALAVPGPTRAQTRTLLAVADFADMGTDGGKMIHAERLSGYLQQRVQALAGDRLRVVAGDEVRAAMLAQEVTPVDLLRRPRAATVAAAVGASRIVTGSWRMLSIASGPDNPPGVTPRGNERRGTAIIDVWVIDGSSGAVVLQGSYVGRAWGQGRLALLEAAREALDQAANAIARM